MAYVQFGPNPPQYRIDFDVITDTFNTLIAHWKPYLTAGLVLLAAALPGTVVTLFPFLEIIGVPTEKLFDWYFFWIVKVLLWLPALMITPLVAAGITKFSLNVTRGNPPIDGDIWEGFRRPFSYLGTGIVMGLIALAGVLLLCVGFYVFSGLMMFTFAIRVDTGCSTGDAINKSWAMLKAEWVMAGIFFFLIFLIAGLGSTVVYVGAIFTLPFLYIAQVHLYNKYTGHYQKPAPAHHAQYTQVPQQPQQQQPPSPGPGSSWPH